MAAVQIYCEGRCSVHKHCTFLHAFSARGRLTVVRKGAVPLVKTVVKRASLVILLAFSGSRVFKFEASEQPPILAVASESSKKQTTCILRHRFTTGGPSTTRLTQLVLFLDLVA